MGFSTYAKDLLFPVGGLILITGANGHVASNIVTEALALGFRVRGTVRTEDKIAALKMVFKNPNYSSVLIEDMHTPDAFDDAVQGVDAIILTATKLPGPADPMDIVPQTVAAAVSVLNSALSAPSVKRIVWTGTIPIVFRPGEVYKQDGNTWAEDAVAAAWAPPPYAPECAWVNYKAAKNEAEHAIYDFVKTKQPNFTVNSVLPCTVFGRIVTKPSDTGKWPRSILNGEVPSFGGNGRKPLYILPVPISSRHHPFISLTLVLFIEWYINMTDVARIHLAAAFDATIIGQRFIAAADKFDWNKLIDEIQKLKPSAKVAPHYPEPIGRDLGENENAPGAALLTKWWDQKGYTSLEQTLRDNLAAEL